MGKKTAKKSGKNATIFPKKSNSANSGSSLLKRSTDSAPTGRPVDTSKMSAKKAALYRAAGIRTTDSWWKRRRKLSKARAEASKRKHAEALAKLPKEPVKRFFAKLAPRYFFGYWFSVEGQKKIWRAIGIFGIICVIGVAGLFAYYKKELNNINLDEMEISETVNTYLDRNGVVLWEDKGSDDYRLVVDGSEISTYMRQATVAIEDRNFYKHPGVDLKALLRAAISTLTGQGVQGGSTLTQQLIKQVYFSEEAASEDRGGITRKIKELILALQLEKMYDKEAIITMYLNQSPYGGRRNGVESAAQTYFNKSAKDLTLAESALLASIPNNPGVLNPYNEYGNEMLIERQQKTLDVMVEMGYITQEEADEAKAVDILDTIVAESSQYDDIKAPHFVLEVKSQLEEKYGISTMRAGGYTITTTLDYSAQQIAEEAVATGKDLLYTNGSDNIAMTSVDVETGQVIAQVGSVDWNIAEYGEVNAATALLEPGSSIKPILDYAPLFVQREGQNFGPGTVLADENIDSIYCAGYTGTCMLRNYTGKFYGNVTIREALANSLNIPAVKALYINGVENSLAIAQGLGEKSYCVDTDTAGLSMALGSGCRTTTAEHANSYASLARGGVYKELTYVLEVKNSSGDIIEQWEDAEGEQIVDPQVAYMISSILSDAAARAKLVFGSQSYAFGFTVPGVWTASKTGTSTTASSSETKDSWIASYSTAVATVVWNGNHDGSGLKNSGNTVVRRVVNDYMERVHKEVYAANGKWSSGDEPAKPAGIQTLTVNGKTDIWPSWYNSSTSGVSKETLNFNKYTYKLATSCTPSDQLISVEVTKIIDPMTKNEIYTVPEPYTRDEEDDCSYSPLVISTVSIISNGKLRVSVSAGSTTLNAYELKVNGQTVASGSASSTFLIDYSVTGNESSIQVIVSDTSGATDTYNLDISKYKSSITDKSTDDTTE